MDEEIIEPIEPPESAEPAVTYPPLSEQLALLALLSTRVEALEAIAKPKESAEVKAANDALQIATAESAIEITEAQTAVAVAALEAEAKAIEKGESEGESEDEGEAESESEEKDESEVIDVADVLIKPEEKKASKKWTVI
jgi:hypothetical protein